MHRNGNDVVSSFITHIVWERLPLAVQRKARMALLDTLGATVAGTLTPVSRIAADYAVETWPSDEATILRHGQRALAVGAAFANGYAATAWTLTTAPSTPVATLAHRFFPRRSRWPNRWGWAARRC